MIKIIYLDRPEAWVPSTKITALIVLAYRWALTPALFLSHALVYGISFLMTGTAAAAVVERIASSVAEECYDTERFPFENDEDDLEDEEFEEDDDQERPL